MVKLYMQRPAVLDMIRSQRKERTRMTTCFWVPLAVFIVVAFAGNVYCSPVFDQGFTDVTCSGCVAGLDQVLDDGFPFGGQTVTAGISGNLTSVSIFAAQGSGIITPWILDIVAAPGGIANGTLLASSDPFTLPTAWAYDWTSISIPSLPFMAAGTSFAIIMHLQGVTGPCPCGGGGGWEGGIYATDPYLGGQPVFGNALDSLQLEGTFPLLGRGDLFFQTFVDTVPESAVPEPSTLALAVCGLAVIATWNRRGQCRSRRPDNI